MTQEANRASWRDCLQDTPDLTARVQTIGKIVADYFGVEYVEVPQYVLQPRKPTDLTHFFKEDTGGEVIIEGGKPVVLYNGNPPDDRIYHEIAHVFHMLNNSSFLESFTRPKPQVESQDFRVVLAACLQHMDVFNQGLFRKISTEALAYCVQRNLVPGFDQKREAGLNFEYELDVPPAYDLSSLLFALGRAKEVHEKRHDFYLTAEKLAKVPSMDALEKGVQHFKKVANYFGYTAGMQLGHRFPNETTPFTITKGCETPGEKTFFMKLKSEAITKDELQTRLRNLLHKPVLEAGKELLAELRHEGEQMTNFMYANREQVLELIQALET